MPPTYAVQMSFNARQNVSQAFDQMGRGAQRFQDHASTALRNATKHGYDFQAIVKGILAANLIRGSIDQLGSGARKVGGDFLEFNDVLLGALARFDEFDRNADKIKAAFPGVAKAVRDSVIGTRSSAVDAAKAMNELAKANYDVKSSMGILPNLLAFAAANQESLAEATTMSSDILGGFGLKSKNAEEQVKNHIALNDKLTKASLLSTGGLRDLYETLQTAAPLSKELKMSVDEVLALSVILSNAGIKGSEAATALKRASLNVYAPAGGMGAELKANGIDVSDKQTGRLRNFTVVLGEISKKLAKIKNQELKIAILRDLFGMYGIGGSFKLLQAFGEVKEIQDKIAGAPLEQTTQKVADLANSSGWAKLINLGNVALEFGFKILDGLGDKGTRGVDALTRAISGANAQPFIDALNLMGSAVGAFAAVLKDALPIIALLVGRFYAVKVAVWGFSVAQIVYGIGLMIVSMVKGIGVIGTLSSAFAWLNAAIAANPIGAIVTGITLAIAAVVLLEKKFHFLSRTLDWFKDKFSWIFETIKRFGAWAFPGYEEAPAETRAPSFPAPNAKEAEARQSTFSGLLTIAGAPAGSSFTDQSGLGAPSVRVNMLGAQ